MSETVLNALVQLFALISDIHEETIITSREKNIVRTFLSRHLNNDLAERYMKLFEDYLGIYNSESITKDIIKARKHVSLNAMRILEICERINEELRQNQKIYVLIQLLDFISLGEEITENEIDFLQTVADAFNIPAAEYQNIKCFIMSDVHDVKEKNKLLIMDGTKQSEKTEIKHMLNENLKGSVSFLNIASTNTYIMRYAGGEDLYLNGQNISPGQTYIFDRGSSIRGAGIRTVYYSGISSRISETSYKCRISLDANDVSFRFGNSDNGIHDLNFHGECGELIGILGGSGVGKSTTLSILNGTLKPQDGKVLINGYDLYDENEKDNLKGVIGFVPQDDLLIEELTVYQNIYYNAKMCLNNLAENKLVEAVNKILTDFDLEEIKDLKVGNPLKKIISGGQRKRVNIALELLREPTILFVDEPTSGLSSVDSEAVMNLLKEQTYKGKLVIINIHQPGSEIYKMFDKIMIIDKGGYQDYFGNPTEAIVYFKTVSKHANPDEDQCVKCGNVDTDQILQIVEAKVVNEHGKATRIRKVSPKEWAEKFREKSDNKAQGKVNERQAIPENNFSIPGLFKQSVIFFTRDFLSKAADKQYIFISLLGPPLLAFLLAFFTRYANETYKLSENDNVPAYLFMCVITSLFFGLMISSEEIVKDRKILKRESFLHLSWFSYLNSKVMILFLVSAFQTISFVLIGNLILGIKGMTLSFWLVLFTTSCSANILGLNISSAFNSVVTIYILIPFIVIPQLLFSGVLVKFDQLHLSSRSSKEYVPVIGDMMTARWSFEALAVEQFRNNKFEKQTFRYNMDASQNYYYGAFLINDKLNKDLWICRTYSDSADSKELAGDSFTRLNHHIDELAKLTRTEPGSWKDSLNAEKFNQNVNKEAAAYLNSLRKYFMDSFKKANSVKDHINDSLKKALGEVGLIAFREENENKRLKLVVLDIDNPEKIIRTPEKYIQKYEPGYMKAASKYGRAHFYAPNKLIGETRIDTYWFNMLVIWLVSALLYLALYFNLLKKLMTWFGNLRLPKSET
ncbi:MAG: ATP-binding cassette domain-containing protein [Bacteroidia bacterium]|nr:ATP-binding cassette domain-containing protein [Bacteroidia bacterium]